MHKSKKALSDFIWEDFKCLMNSPFLFNSYVDYFIVLVDWIKKYKRDLEYSVYWKRLNVILDIDINDYISKEPELLLKLEAKRVFSLKPSTVDSFVMRLCDTVWDLVKLRSEKECPGCKEDNLNYVVAEIPKTAKKELVLECDTCGRLFNIDGTEWSDGAVVIHPANEKIVNEYLSKK